MSLGGERPVVSETTLEDFIDSSSSFLRSTHAPQRPFFDTLLLATEHFGSQPVVRCILKKFRPQIAFTTQGVSANFSACYVLQILGIHFCTSEVECMNEFVCQQTPVLEWIVNEIATQPDFVMFW
jgi:hypothetical protein